MCILEKNEVLNVGGIVQQMGGGTFKNLSIDSENQQES